MKSPSSPYDSPRILWLILIGFLLIWFYMLGARTLVPTDEGRYAEMAREMFVSGDWITPRLNSIKYFEKPPLQAWMNVITFEAFGVGAWQARLWTGLCGLLSIALVAHTGRQLFSARIGIHAALVLASSLLWAISAHYNSLDMAVAAMMSISLCGLLLSQRQQASATEQRNGMLWCWTGMALAVLTKGLIGIVLPGAVLVIYTLLTRDWSIWKRLHMGKGLLLFFAIVSPWFILVALKNPEHPQFFFIHEHLQRFTSDVHKRYQPAHFFVGILIAGITPWLGLLLQAMWSATKQEKSGFQPKKMLLVWTVFIFVFFSASSSKLTGYLLPIFPALALLIACQLESASTKTLQLAAGIFAGSGLLGLALLASGKLTGKPMPALELALNQAAVPWIAAVSAIALAGGLLALLLAARQKDWAILSIAVAGFICGQTFMLAYEPWGYYRAGLLHLKAIQAELTPATPIYAVGTYEQCLPFYLGRTVTLVEFADELEFGLGQQPELWIPKRSDFIQKWRDTQALDKPAIAILRPKVYQELFAQQLPMRIIGQDTKRVIVSSRLLPETK